MIPLYFQRQFHIHTTRAQH